VPHFVVARRLGAWAAQTLAASKKALVRVEQHAPASTSNETAACEVRSLCDPMDSCG